MAGQTQPEGKCYFCQEIMTRRKLFNHLGKCVKRKEAIEKAEKSNRSSQTLFHLRAKHPYANDFWLDLEVKGSASLFDIDEYLKDIWLECCGHMSEFSRGNFFRDEIEMDKTVETTFKKEKAIYHSYDFGTTSETIVELIGTRQGKSLTKNPMFLMSRNQMPEMECLDCNKVATHLCVECLYEDESNGMLCDEHTESHPHDNYGDPIRLVNSPRLGMCGYEGPAEPPY